MAESTNTTGVSQATLDQVLRSGYANIDASLFNTARSNIQAPALQQINLPQIQITAQNAPNTSPQNRQLTNQFLDVNQRNFDLQSQQVRNQYDLQVQSLEQSQKDAQSRNLMAFGQSSFVNPSESSRNLSMVTDVNAKVQREVRNIGSQASLQLNQIATNYATQNLNALNTNRQNDFQDRQFNLSEALQRGAETGQLYDYNRETGKVENTGKLNLAGKNFDASMTGWYNDFNNQKQRTLAAKQIDSNLIDANIKRALTVSDLTGLMPELGSAQTPDGLANSAFDFTRNTGQLTVQGQLNQAALAQSDYTRNLYGSMNNAGLYNQEVQAKSALLDAQIDQALTSRAQGEQTRAELDYLKKNPQLWQAVSPEATNNLMEMKVLKDLMDKETDPVKKEAFAKQYFADYQKHAAEYGEGDQIYYKTVPEFDAKDNLKEEKFYYNTDALAKYGLNGAIEWSSNDPKKQEGISQMKSKLTEEFLNAFVKYPDDPSKAVNKLIYKNPGNENELVLGLRSVVKTSDGKEIPSGYEYTKVDMSKLSTEQKMQLEGELRTTIVQGSKDMTEYNNSLKRARDIIDKYDKIDGTVAETLTSTKAVEALQRFGILGKEALDGYTNGKALSMLLLGSNSAGNAIITKDTNLASFNAGMKSLQTTLQTVANKASNDGIKIQPDEIFKQIASGDEFIQLGTGANKQPITLPNNSRGDKDLISTMIKWYDQYQTSGIQGKGSETLDTILQLNDITQSSYNANGNPISMEYLFAGSYLT